MKIETPTGPLTIFQKYAPNCTYSDTTLDVFYEVLQTEINKLPAKSRLIILGDLNATVGNDCLQNWPSVAGKFGLGNRNCRGDRLLHFCAINNLTILNTLY